MPLHQYDYLMAIGTIFAFLDAWNIGKELFATPRIGGKSTPPSIMILIGNRCQ
jgi:hypothetical protein